MERVTKGRQRAREGARREHDRRTRRRLREEFAVFKIDVEGSWGEKAGVKRQERLITEGDVTPRHKR